MKSRRLLWVLVLSAIVLIVALTHAFTHRSTVGAARKSDLPCPNGTKECPDGSCIPTKESC